MFITPPVSQHPGQQGALLATETAHLDAALVTQMRGWDPICEPLLERGSETMEPIEASNQIINTNIIGRVIYVAKSSRRMGLH